MSRLDEKMKLVCRILNVLFGQQKQKQKLESQGLIAAQANAEGVELQSSQCRRSYHNSRNQERANQLNILESRGVASS